MAGHVWPVFLRFKGGKGVATMAGVLFAMNWFAALIGVGVWALTFCIGRYVSLASILAAVAMPFANHFTKGHILERWEAPWIVTVFFSLAAVLVIVNHRSNIRKLREKKETRVRFRRARGAGGTT